MCRWCAERSDAEVMAEREEVIMRIEKVGSHLRRSGACRAWLSDASPEIQLLAATVNGPLLQHLAQ